MTVLNLGSVLETSSRRESKLWKPHLLAEEICFNKFFLLVCYLISVLLLTASVFRVDQLVQH